MKTSESSIVHRTCTKCEVVKPLTSFGKHMQGKFGRRSICKCCVALRNRRYHQTPRGRAVIKRSRANFIASDRGKQWRRDKAQRHRLHNPDKAKARSAVSQAIRAGWMIVPEFCSTCGQVGRVEAHHFKGYAKDHWLDVRWLCKTCHFQEHAMERHIPMLNVA